MSTVLDMHDQPLRDEDHPSKDNPDLHSQQRAVVDTAQFGEEAQSLTKSSPLLLRLASSSAFRRVLLSGVVLVLFYFAAFPHEVTSTSSIIVDTLGNERDEGTSGGGGTLSLDQGMRKTVARFGSRDKQSVTTAVVANDQQEESFDADNGPQDRHRFSPTRVRPSNQHHLRNTVDDEYCASSVKRCFSMWCYYDMRTKQCLSLIAATTRNSRSLLNPWPGARHQNRCVVNESRSRPLLLEVEKHVLPKIISHVGEVFADHESGESTNSGGVTIKEKSATTTTPPSSLLHGTAALHGRFKLFTALPFESWRDWLPASAAAAAVSSPSGATDTGWCHGADSEGTEAIKTSTRFSQRQQAANILEGRSSQEDDTFAMSARHESITLPPSLSTSSRAPPKRMTNVYRMKNFCLRPVGRLAGYRPVVEEFQGQDDVFSYTKDTSGLEPFRRWLRDVEKLNEPPECFISKKRKKLIIMPVFVRADNPGHVFHRMASALQIKEEVFGELNEHDNLISEDTVTIVYLLLSPGEQYPDPMKDIHDLSTFMNSAHADFLEVVTETHFAVVGGQAKDLYLQRLARRLNNHYRNQETNVADSSTTSSSPFFFSSNSLERLLEDTLVCFEEAVVYFTCTTDECYEAAKAKDTAEWKAREQFAIEKRMKKKLRKSKPPIDYSPIPVMLTSSPDSSVAWESSFLEQNQREIFPMYHWRSSVVMEKMINVLKRCAFDPQQLVEVSDETRIQRQMGLVATPIGSKNGRSGKRTLKILLAHRSRHRRFALAPLLLGELLESLGLVSSTPSSSQDIRKVPPAFLLKDLFPQLSFELTVLEMQSEEHYFSTTDLVKIYSTKADIVIGPYGAGLFNSIFMAPGSVVVELHQDGKRCALEYGLNKPSSQWCDYGGNFKVRDIHYIVSGFPAVSGGRMFGELDIAPGILPLLLKNAICVLLTDLKARRSGVGEEEDSEGEDRLTSDELEKRCPFPVEELGKLQKSFLFDEDGSVLVMHALAKGALRYLNPKFIDFLQFGGAQALVDHPESSIRRIRQPVAHARASNDPRKTDQTKILLVTSAGRRSSQASKKEWYESKEVVAMAAILFSYTRTFNVHLFTPPEQFGRNPWLKKEVRSRGSSERSGHSVFQESHSRSKASSSMNSSTWWSRRQIDKEYAGLAGREPFSSRLTRCHEVIGVESTQRWQGRNHGRKRTRSGEELHEGGGLGESQEQQKADILTMCGKFDLIWASEDISEDLIQLLNKNHLKGGGSGKKKPQVMQLKNF